MCAYRVYMPYLRKYIAHTLSHSVLCDVAKAGRIQFGLDYVVACDLPYICVRAEEKQNFWERDRGVFVVGPCLFCSQNLLRFEGYGLRVRVHSKKKNQNKLELLLKRETELLENSRKGVCPRKRCVFLNIRTRTWVYECLCFRLAEISKDAASLYTVST